VIQVLSHCSSRYWRVWFVSYRILRLALRQPRCESLTASVAWTRWSDSSYYIHQKDNNRRQSLENNEICLANNSVGAHGLFTTLHKGSRVIVINECRPLPVSSVVSFTHEKNPYRFPDPWDWGVHTWIRSTALLTFKGECGVYWEIRYVMNVLLIPVFLVLSWSELSLPLYGCTI